MNKYTIISYATNNTPYVDLMRDYLQVSLTKFKLKYHLSTIEGGRTWYDNTALKSQFVLDKLNELNEDVVWIDADAKVEKYPIFFDEIPEEYDISYHTLSWNQWYGYKGKDVKELLTGTMYFRNRKIVKDLCKEWHEEAVKSNEWEQKVLQRIIGKYNLKVYPLPLEYIYIDSLPRGGKPIVKLDPVIRHYQASRMYKKTLHIRGMLDGRKKGN
jgi:hypothetical protein